MISGSIETYLTFFFSSHPSCRRQERREADKILRKKVVYRMPGLNEMKNSGDPQLAERLVSNYVAPGTRLKLRGDVCQQVKERDWIFNKVKDNMIFLVHETRAHGIVVGIEDIDWTGL